jgi:hypothetical protein
VVAQTSGWTGACTPNPCTVLPPPLVPASKLSRARLYPLSHSVPLMSLQSSAYADGDLSHSSRPSRPYPCYRPRHGCSNAALPIGKFCSPFAPLPYPPRCPSSPILHASCCRARICSNFHLAPACITRHHCPHVVHGGIRKQMACC